MICVLYIYITYKIYKLITYNDLTYNYLLIYYNYELARHRVYYMLNALVLRCATDIYEVRAVYQTTVLTIKV